MLLIQLSLCLGDKGQSYDDWSVIVYDDGNYGHQQNGGIERPCSLHDVDCIRGYFAHYSRCSPVHGKVPDSQRIKSIPMSVPHVNVTFNLKDVEVKGFSDFKIKELYINKKTARLVFEVEFRRIWVYSPSTVITFRRRGKEPLVLADYAFIEYKDLSLTLTAPHDKEIKLSEANVYTYISDAEPKQGLGPNFTENKDPQVQAALKRLIENIGLSLQEAFVTQGPIFMAVFLQNAICRY